MDENKLNMEQINVSSGITETTSTSASGKSKSTAIQLGFNVWTHNEIECPGDEVWYKFTPSTTGYYRIYTSGSLDTVGYLYDSNNNLLDDGDDEYSGLNYEITQRLTGGRTYYIKTVAYGNATGNFAIKLTNDIKISSLAIEEENVTVGRFREYQLTPIITPSYASNQNLFWESTDPSVVTVESSTGKITGAGEGWARVCAYAQDGSGKVACCEVTVNVLVDLVRTFPPELTLRVGEVDKLYASVYPPDADEQDYYWVSDDNEVAYVNHKGEVTAVGVGSTKVYALSTVDYSYATEECNLTVLPAIPVTGIVMCAGEHTMKVGDAETFTCDIYPSNASNKKVVWCSNNPQIARVDSITGKVTAVSPGETIITATTDDGGYVGDCLLKVKEYCGGSNYCDVTKHTMILQNDGYFVCSRCGYKVKSPELEDSDILSSDDYLKVFSCILFYSYLKILQESIPQNPNISEAQNIVLQLATEIRQKTLERRFPLNLSISIPKTYPNIMVAAIKNTYTGSPQP